MREASVISFRRVKAIQTAMAIMLSAADRIIQISADLKNLVKP